MTHLFFDPVFLEHRTGQHPESPARLEHLYQYLDDHGFLERVTRGQIRSATQTQLEAIHDSAYISALELAAQRGGGRIESDTVISTRSFEVARLAAGTAATAVDAVFQTDDPRAVCLMRPPGHHALANAPMGFCLFNNVAIAAAHARHAYNLSRVLIVDWDVHHGNGTQDAFYADENVWFFSAHRSPFYPGTGDPEETGTGAGLGTTFNLPFSIEVTRTEYIAQFSRMLEDVVTRAQPELILLSAGFDTHVADPVGSLGLETEDFEPLTKVLLEAAKGCGGRLVSLLEGGYNVRALAESVGCHLETLLDAHA